MSSDILSFTPSGSTVLTTSCGRVFSSTITLYSPLFNPSNRYSPSLFVVAVASNVPSLSMSSLTSTPSIPSPASGVPFPLASTNIVSPMLPVGVEKSPTEDNSTAAMVICPSGTPSIGSSSGTMSKAILSPS